MHVMSGGLQQFTIMFIFIFILHIAFVLFSFFYEYLLFYFATDEPGVCGLWWLSWGSTICTASPVSAINFNSGLTFNTLW